ncbi:unnamed protein product [Penicillium pancosmium]
MTPKVALITGGASGMGLAVATALSTRPDWEIHILDINSERGSQAARSLARTTSHYADVTKYNILGEAFQQCFQAQKRLDFVFANAGVIERFNFYESHPISEGDTVTPPPEPDLLSIDADLKGVILTTYLAQHYFRASPNQVGVVGFMRSIAQHFKAGGIRVNAICPGIVRTNLVDQGGWNAFPQHRFTEMETVVRVVLQLVGQSEPAVQGLTDTRGTHLPMQRLFGLAVEISDSGVYFREQHEFCDDGMREVMAATVLENQVGAILNNN